MNYWIVILELVDRNSFLENRGIQRLNNRHGSYSLKIHVRSIPARNDGAPCMHGAPSYSPILHDCRLSGKGLRSTWSEQKYSDVE